MISAELILPLACAYARHAGLGDAPAPMLAQLERRLTLAPLWARAYFAAGALFVRWLAPWIYAGRATTFEDLAAAEREGLLESLQRETRPPLRALFLGIKTILVIACYADAGRAVRAGGPVAR